MVDSRTKDGGSRRFFGTKTEAQTFAQQCRVARGNSGTSIFGNADLASYGKTVGDAVAFYLAHLRRQEKSVTVEEATGTARAEFELLLLGRRDETLVWRVHVQSDWREEDGAWVVTGTDWRTLEGRQP